MKSGSRCLGRASVMGPIFSGTRGNDGVAPKTVAGSPVDPARHPETCTQADRRPDERRLATRCSRRPIYTSVLPVHCDRAGSGCAELLRAEDVAGDRALKLKCIALTARQPANSASYPIAGQQ